MTLKRSLLLTIVIILVLMLTVFFTLHTILISIGFGGLNFLPSKTLGPLPEIQYAEFPFKLVYTVNEDTYVMEDVLIGEFVRNNYNMGLGIVERVWRARLKSGKKKITLYSNNEIEIFYQPTESDPNIIGTFMGEDTVYSAEQLMRVPSSIYVAEGKNTYYISVEELKSTYNIVLSWEIAPPIENRLEEYTHEYSFRIKEFRE